MSAAVSGHAWAVRFVVKLYVSAKPLAVPKTVSLCSEDDPLNPISYAESPRLADKFGNKFAGP